MISIYKRLFSSSPSPAREYFHVVRRRVKQVPKVEVGDSIYRLRKPQEYPPYPYGPALLYKQSDKGLYGGRMIQFGNRISEKFKQKNTRTFKPNVQKVKLFSEALNKTFQIKVVTAVLRTITKEGGVDNYLIKDKSARIKELGMTGWKMRYDVLKALETKEQRLNEIVEGLTVSRLTLINDLYDSLDASVNAYSRNQFRIKHEKSTPEQLIGLLEEQNVDTSKYRIPASQTAEDASVA